MPPRFGFNRTTEVGYSTLTTIGGGTDCHAFPPPHAADRVIAMPGYSGKAKAPHEMTNGELIATLIASTVICGVIATGLIVTLVRNYSVVFTLLFCGAGLAFIVYFYVLASWGLLGEMLRRRNARR
jgi:hypothetical protein